MHKCLMVGVGGMARSWITRFFAPFVDEGRMEFAALVDISPDALQAANATVGLPESHLFTDARQAFATVEADFCCIVTPPAFHREVVELACERGLHILSEKPISDTWESCCAVAKSVRAANVKMQVTQNYRYNVNIQTLKAAVSELGAVNYAVGRYASDYRVRNSWGKFRHEIPHTLLVEGGIHHFDQLRHLTQADCEVISGFEWHPNRTRDGEFAGADSFDGEPCALFVMQMSNGSFASYEGNNLATGKLNSWHSEYYRVECEGGVAVLDRDNVVRVETRQNGQLIVREVPNAKPEYVGHVAMPAQFLSWLDGGEVPPTALDDNLKSNATMFAAIQASQSRQSVRVGELLAQATG